MGRLWTVAGSRGWRRSAAVHKRLICLPLPCCLSSMLPSRRNIVAKQSHLVRPAGAGPAVGEAPLLTLAGWHVSLASCQLRSRRQLGDACCWRATNAPSAPRGDSCPIPPVPSQAAAPSTETTVVVPPVSFVAHSLLCGSSCNHSLLPFAPAPFLTRAAGKGRTTAKVDALRLSCRIVRVFHSELYMV